MLPNSLIGDSDVDCQVQDGRLLLEEESPTDVDLGDLRAEGTTTPASGGQRRGSGLLGGFQHYCCPTWAVEAVPRREKKKRSNIV